MIGRRIAVGAAVLALVAAVAWSDRLPVSAVPEPRGVTATVEAAPLPRACPGPVSIPVGDTTTGDESLDAGSDDRTFRELASAPEPNGEGFRTQGAVGAQMERVGSGDVEGLSSTACTAPRLDQWILGGSTVLGASARLVLTNPAEAATEVTVALHGTLGEIEQTTVVSVGAHGQADLLLEGVAAEVPALAVHVTATGAGVVAAVQDSRLSGFQPAGTDWATAGAQPATSLVIPAVGPADADSPGVVRLLAPEGATVDLVLAGADGAQAWGGVTGLTLEPGVVTDVPLPETGAAGVVVEADGPVVAAALTRTVRQVEDGPSGAMAYDLAWSAGVEPDGAAHAAVAGSYTDAVSVHAVTGGTFRLVDDEGEVVVERVIAAGVTAQIPVSVPSGTVLTAEGTFVWTLVAHGDPGYLAYTAPQPTATVPQEITVEAGVYPTQ